MALVTFPLTLAQFYNLLPIAKAELDLPEALDMSQTAGGEVLTSDLGASLWAGRIDLGVMTHDEVSAIRPLINVLRRAGSSFLVSDPTRPWPRLDPNGTLLGAATPTILAVGGSMRELSLSGLPAGYHQMISFARMREDDPRLPDRFAAAPELPFGAIALPRGADVTALMRMMRVGGVWVERPLPIVQTDQTGVTTVTLADAPTGTTCRIIDLLTDDLLFAGQSEAGAIWTLPDPGLYAVEIDPPLPWLPVNLRLEVVA